MSGFGSNRNSITVLVISILFIVTISVAGYFLYHNLKQPAHKATDAIPLDADLVVKIKSPLGTWNEDLSQSDIWKGISVFENLAEFGTSIHWLDSLIGTDALIRKIVNENPLYISVHPMADSSYSALFLIEIPHDFNGGAQKFLTRIAPSTEFNVSKYGKVQLYKNKQSSKFSFYVEDGLFVGSFSQSLLIKSADQIKSKVKLTDNAQYQQVALSEGSKTGISIYINHSNAYHRLSKYFNQTINPWTLSAGDVQGWSNTDILLRKDLLLMSGYIATTDLSYLQCLNGAPLADASFAKELDESTFYLYSISIRTFDSYEQTYHNFQQKNHYTPDASKYNQGDSAATLQTNTALWKKIDPTQLVISSGIYSDSVGWIITVKPRDIVVATQALIDEMTSRAGVKGEMDTITYKGYKIGKLSMGESARIFGDQTFSQTDIHYFAICNNFIQFSSSKKNITRIIDRKKEGNSLENSYIFKSFCNDLNPNSTLLIYLSPFEGYRFVKGQFDSLTAMGRLLQTLTAKTPYLGLKIGEYEPPYFSSSFCWKYLINSAPSAKEDLKEDKSDHVKAKNQTVTTPKGKVKSSKLAKNPKKSNPKKRKSSRKKEKK